MKLKLLFVLMLMLVMAIFSVQNATVITVRFLVWQFAVSQALVILLAGILGALIGLAVGAFAARPAVPAPTRTAPPRQDLE